MFVLIWSTLLFTATGSATSNNTTCGQRESRNISEATSQTATDGLCVVVQCSLGCNVTSTAWYKCQPPGECKKIFQSCNNTTTNTEPVGLVCLLEPDLKKNNCSIIINYLSTSDARSYQANITLEVIKPILDIPPLMKEQNVTLTCSVPDFCSGSKLQFSNATDKNMMTITVNNTEFIINMMTSHTSILTFKVSAEHHKFRVAFRLNFPGNMTSEKTLNVSYQNFFNLLKAFFEDHLLFLIVVFGVGFLIGSLVSTFIVCLAIKCHRNKKKKSYSAEELELVATESVYKDCDDDIPHVQDNDTLDFQDDGIQTQVAAECGEEPAGDLIDSDMSPKEAVYSDIDFSALKDKNPANTKDKENTTESEYAEIKTGEMEEAQENEGMDCGMLEENDETEVMLEHQVEAKQGMVAEEIIGEDVPLYSNTNEVMDEN